MAKKDNEGNIEGNISNVMFDFIVSVIKSREVIDQTYCDYKLEINKDILKAHATIYDPTKWASSDLKTREDCEKSELRRIDLLEQRYIAFHKGSVSALSQMVKHFQEVHGEIVDDAELNENIAPADADWYEIPFQYVVKKTMGSYMWDGRAKYSCTIGFQKHMEENDILKHYDTYIDY